MKLGIIGSGKIVHEALFAMEELENIKKNAIFVRPHSLEKGQKLSEQYGIPEVYTDYEKLLKEADVDTVYIGLVNSAHHAYAKQALMAGKHVILEKPFTSTVAEAEDLIRTAKDNGVYILEAITILHGPCYSKVQEWLPKVGELRIVQENYSQFSSRYPAYQKKEVAPCFDPELSGGSLYDINLYNVYFAVATFGDPVSCTYFGNFGFNGTDTSGIEVLTYPGFVATLTGAKDSDSPSFTSIQGELGWIRINGRPNVPTSIECSWWDSSRPEGVKSNSGGVDRAMFYEKLELPTLRHRMTPEFTDFARIIDEQDCEAAEACMHNSVAVMKVLEVSRKEAGMVFGVDKQ